MENIEKTELTSTDTILPAFVNAHTHLGDSDAKEAAVGLSLNEAVAPSDGVNYPARSLRSLRRSEAPP
ncbi:hypothetical protein JCM17092_29060 [Haloplanus litoreus]